MASARRLHGVLAAVASATPLPFRTIKKWLAVFEMHPVMEWHFGHELAAFIILEHVMLCLQGAIKVGIADESADVVRIEDFNDYVKAQVFPRPPLELDKPVRLVGLDIGPRGDGPDASLLVSTVSEI